MIRRLPIVPTIIVIAAAAIMVALGFWQLGRHMEKVELKVRYLTTVQDGSISPLTSDNVDDDSLWYRSVSLDCAEVTGVRTIAGTNAVGAKGWSHIVECSIIGAAQVEVAIGWSRDPSQIDWSGGAVTGTMDPRGKVVASPPLAGLRPLALPDPSDLPNNHLAYAGQWFFFALSALVIYGFAVRSRLRKPD